MTFALVRDGCWATEGGDTIRRVAPKGLTLYALRTVGSKRPEWFATLAEAKKHRTR